MTDVQVSFISLDDHQSMRLVIRMLTLVLPLGVSLWLTQMLLVF